MLNNEKVGTFISAKRREQGFTQLQLAEKLCVSFQAVSKWENGTSYPNTELLLDLAQVLNVTVDEILHGKGSEHNSFTYSKAGIDVHYTDEIKKEMSRFLKTDNPRVLNGIGPFASLYDISFDSIKNPVMVLKSEEPGSKQKLAMEYGYTESICHDMINHLVNDVIVMGATPLAVLDTIVCGNAEKETIKSLVKGISDACRANDCSLVGGETSIQPNVVDKGTYILTASLVGIVERSSIIDGSSIACGDVILAVASNGLHTNGYSLVRLLMDEIPHIKNEIIGEESFISAIMKPHLSYYKAIRGLFKNGQIKGMAHITGGGIEGNVKRIIPEGLCAAIDISKIEVPPIFKYIKFNGNISDEEMLNTFNCGVGLVMVVEKSSVEQIKTHILKWHNCYEIGEICDGCEGNVLLNSTINW